MLNTKKEIEKAVLVYFSVKDGKNSYEHIEALNELSFLAATAGAEVVKSFYQFSHNYD